jgi:hypothetical protein
MRRSPSRSRSQSLTDELAELCRFDLIALKRRWRGSTAPKRRPIGQALLLQVVAYRLQERALGGLKSSPPPARAGRRTQRRPATTNRDARG